MINSQMTIQNKKSYNEILEIIKYIENNYYEKIPKDLIAFFEENKAENYTFIYDNNKNLKENKLLDETITLLAILNVNYFQENELHKKELLNLYKQNELNYHTILENSKIDFNSDSIFKKQDTNTSNNQNISTDIIEYQKTTVLKKLFNNLKKFFNI